MKAPTFSGWLSAFTLASRVKVRARFEPEYSRLDFFLPTVGPFASLAFALGFAAAFLAFSEPSLAALSGMFAQYAAFNLFHLDGLLDSADALLPWASAERRREILKDPRIGSFALFAGFFTLAARAAGLCALASRAVASADWAPLVALALAAPAAGRLSAVFVACLGTPANPGGLGALAKGCRPGFAISGFAIALLPLAGYSIAAGAWLVPSAMAAASLACAFAVALSVSRSYRKKIGGYSGDALGAAVELTETLTTLAALLLSARLPG
jgi:adenosylcobinamide-GDP ribazoletransferase